jgi:hypothetical protein
MVGLVYSAFQNGQFFVGRLPDFLKSVRKLPHSKGAETAQTAPL